MYNNISNNTMRFGLPTVEGGGSFNWGKFLKILIAVLTALAGSIGLASCASSNNNDDENDNGDASKAPLLEGVGGGFPCAAAHQRRTCFNCLTFRTKR